MNIRRKLLPLVLCLSAVLLLTGWFPEGSQVKNQIFHCSSKSGDYILTNPETKEEMRLPNDASRTEFERARVDGFTSQTTELIWSCTFSYLDSELIGQNHTITEAIVDSASRYGFDAMIETHNKCRSQLAANEKYKVAVFSGIALKGGTIDVVGLACFSPNSRFMNQYTDPADAEKSSSSS